jgi:hypothetical protein
MRQRRRLVRILDEALGAHGLVRKRRPLRNVEPAIFDQRRGRRAIGRQRQAVGAGRAREARRLRGACVVDFFGRARRFLTQARKLEPITVTLALALAAQALADADDGAATSQGERSPTNRRSSAIHAISFYAAFGDNARAVDHGTGIRNESHAGV